MITDLRVVTEPRRQELLRLLWGGELSAGEIASSVDVTFSAVSQHLKVLREAGVVEQRKEGRRRFYRIRREGLGPLEAVFEQMWGDRLSQLRHLAEQEERQP